MFTADVFQEDCAQKHQSQSFSGIGTHSPNAHAEHAIQTDMYMARTFMLHVLLHRSECVVDDLALWPFAVEHANWLYKRMLSKVTEITMLKCLTMICSDHWNLLRTHIWECSAFMLNTKLQNSQLIPKMKSKCLIGPVPLLL